MAARLNRAHLLAEDAFLHGLLAAAKTATTTLLADLALAPDTHNAIAAVRRASASTAMLVTASIEAGRDGAEQASLDRLGAEWNLVRKKVTGAGHPDPGALPTHHLRAKTSQDDKAAAELVGQSYGSAWGSSVLAAVKKARDADESGATAARDAGEALDYRLERIAATETSRAMADARDDAEDYIAEQYGETDWFPALLMRWDAELDRVVCRLCEDMAGRVRVLGFDFKDGNEPGHVHASCRCDQHLITLPIPLHVDPAELDETELLSAELEAADAA